jgi:hypothetical protein
MAFSRWEIVKPSVQKLRDLVIIQETRVYAAFDGVLK